MHSKNASFNQTSQAPIKALLTSQSSQQIQVGSREHSTNFYTIKFDIKTSESRESLKLKKKCKTKRQSNSRKNKHFSAVKTYFNRQSNLAVHSFISAFITKVWKIRNQDKFNQLMEIKKIGHKKLTIKGRGALRRTFRLILRQIGRSTPASKLWEMSKDIFFHDF